jgi:hypothetical protein
MQLIKIQAGFGQHFRISAKLKYFGMAGTNHT